MKDGIMNKFDLLDGVCVLLENVTVSGQANVTRLSNAFQMLAALKQGLHDEDQAKNKIIETLKEQLKRATEPDVEPGGDVVGGEHYEFNFGGGKE